MPKKIMVCRYCGKRIVWNESQGWLEATDAKPFGIWATANCAHRAPMSDGHALPEDFWD